MNLSKTPEWQNRKSIFDKAFSKVVKFFLFLVNLFKMGGTGSKVNNNGDIENNGDQEQNVGLFQISFDHISGSFMTIIVIMILITIVLVLRRYWKRRDWGRRENRGISVWPPPPPPPQQAWHAPILSPSMEMVNIPRWIDIARPKSEQPSTSKWSPSAARLNKDNNPA